jgi:hypothetical protein
MAVAAVAAAVAMAPSASGSEDEQKALFESCMLGPISGLRPVTDQEQGTRRSGKNERPT